MEVPRPPIPHPYKTKKAELFPWKRGQLGKMFFLPPDHLSLSEGPLGAGLFWASPAHDALCVVGAGAYILAPVTGLQAQSQ